MIPWVQLGNWYTGGFLHCKEVDELKQRWQGDISRLALSSRTQHAGRRVAYIQGMHTQQVIAGVVCRVAAAVAAIYSYWQLQALTQSEQQLSHLGVQWLRWHLPVTKKALSCSEPWQEPELSKP